MTRFSRRHKNELTAEIWSRFYIELIESGRERTAFYGIPRDSVSGFLNRVSRYDEPWWMIFNQDSEPCAMVCLSNISGKRAYIHYACLPVLSISSVVKVLRFGLASILYDKYQDGTYIVNTLVGITPVWNKPAVKALKHIGAALLGEIPDICYCHDSQINAPGMISYFTRDSVPREWIGD